MVGFMREFFKTVFFELRNKLRRRRLRRAYELGQLEEQERDRRKKAVHDEILTRQMKAAIAKHPIPENPYEGASDE